MKNRYIKSFPKHISMNSKLGSLDHPKLEGYVFHIVNVLNPYDDPRHSYDSIGSAKKYLQIESGPSTLNCSPLSYMCLPRFLGRICLKLVYLDTESAVTCFDEGNPEPMKTKIYVSKKNMMRNNSLFINLFPVICVEQDGIRKFGNCLKIDGPCNIIYDNKNYHEFGGTVRIETNSNIKFAEEKTWIKKLRRFLNVS